MMIKSFAGKLESYKKVKTNKPSRQEESQTEKYRHADCNTVFWFSF